MPVLHMLAHSFLHLLTCSFILVNEYSLDPYLTKHCAKGVQKRDLLRHMAEV